MGNPYGKPCALDERAIHFREAGRPSSVGGTGDVENPIALARVEAFAITIDPRWRHLVVHGCGLAFGSLLTAGSALALIHGILILGLAGIIGPVLLIGSIYRLCQGRQIHLQAQIGGRVHDVAIPRCEWRERGPAIIGMVEGSGRPVRVAVPGG